MYKQLAIDRIPKEHIPEIKRIISLFRKNMRFNPKEQTFLFDLYRKYILESNKLCDFNEKCTTCRAKVATVFRNYVDIWTKIEQENEGNNETGIQGNYREPLQKSRFA